jgi:Cu(I)/Ag(I) efflux system membrane fusion protein
MTKAHWVAIIVMVPAAAFLASGIYRRGDGELMNKTRGRRILYYRDPMHPSYKSDRPGKAPDCGMALEPVYEGTIAKTPSSITISPNRQEILGIRLGKAEQAGATRTIRTIGRVALDETRVFPIITGADGWVRRVFPHQTGSFVSKGEPLVTVYGREYMNTQRAYVYALRNQETALPVRAGDYQDDPKFALREARLNMENMGFNETQIQAVASTRQALLDVDLVAPADGVVISRNAYPQQRFERGAELFRIAEFNSVWVWADLFDRDASLIHSGSSARVFPPGQNGKPSSAIVSAALPRFDAEIRVNQVRLQVSNPGEALRPDMVVEVEFPVVFPSTLTVPEEAILDSGLQKIVFVKTGPGTFESRSIETGWHSDRRVQILRGLLPDEIIVVSGNFFLDSESRILHSTSQGHD